MILEIFNVLRRFSTKKNDPPHTADEMFLLKIGMDGVMVIENDILF